jgi:hypothetical protein
MAIQHVCLFKTGAACLFDAITYGAVLARAVRVRRDRNLDSCRSDESGILR